MDAIGTLTKYFPFIKEDTVSILKSIMKDVDSYIDFVACGFFCAIFVIAYC